MKRFTTIALLAACLCFVPACSSEDVVQTKQAIVAVDDAITQAEQVKAFADQAIAAIKAELDTLPEQWQEKALAVLTEYEEQSARAQQFIDQAMPSREALRQKLESLPTDANWADVASDVLEATAPAIPPPYGLIATAVIAIFGLFKSREATKAKSAEQQTLTAATKVVNAIEAAKDADGKVDFSDKSIVNLINGIMGADGKALVDQAQG